MKAFSFLRALLFGSALLIAPAYGDQASIVTPIVGPHTMADYAADVNAAFLAIQSQNSGSSAPANGPGPANVHFQSWCDTTSNPVVCKIYDGASFAIQGKLNTSTHIWTPSYQGTDLGTASIATVGTSGHTVPFLDGTNVWSALQSFNSGQLSLKGSSSGAGTLNAPAAASTFVWTLPAATDTLAALALAQTFTNKTISGSSNTLTVLAGSQLSGQAPVANGGTNCAAASGTCLDNITGFSSTGYLTRTGAGAYTFNTAATSANYLAGTASKVVESGIIYQAEVTVTFSATQTFDFSTFINAAVTLTANMTSMTLSNVMAGKSGQIRFIQDGTGSRLFSGTWPSTFKFAGGVTPTLSTVAAAVDALEFNCTTTTYCVASMINNVK